jgi:hypothetical protein
MTAKVISNRSAYYNSRQGASGIGHANLPDGNIGWVGIVGKAGDVLYLNANDVTANDKPFVGWSLQAIGGAHQVAFTCQNAAMATDPDPNVQNSVVWCEAPTSPGTMGAPGNTTITAGNILLIFFPFSAIRITFAADGEFYVVAR